MNAMKKLRPINLELLNKSKVFIFDCDGVIWKGDSLIRGAANTLSTLRKLGKQVFFVTNNSSKSRQGFQRKFTSLGIEVNASEMLSSSFAAAHYLTLNPLPKGKKALVIGHAGIEEELHLAGIPFISGASFNSHKAEFGPGKMVHHDKNVGAVVVGVDTDINYYKIQYAQLCISENEGCKFIATNLDAVAHLTAEQEWACAGATVGAIRGCTGRKPVVVGKPSSLLIDYITSKCGVSRDAICMVGDRLDTDIVFGRDNGLNTLLTLSGVTTEQKLFAPDNTIIPNYYADSIADLV